MSFQDHIRREIELKKLHRKQARQQLFLRKARPIVLVICEIILLILSLAIIILGILYYNELVHGL